MEPEPPADRPGSSAPGGALGTALRDHPVITAVMLACILAGAALGAFGLPEDWSLLRRLVAGAVAGAGTGLLVTATKMLG